MPNTTFRISPEPIGDWEVGDLIPKGCFTTEDQTELNQRFYETTDESIVTGIWECAPCKFEVENSTVDEQMTIISGALTVVNSDGAEEKFTAGDVLFTSKGSSFTWEVTERLRKFYMIAS